EGFERELWDWLLEKVGPEARSRFPLDAHSAEALYHYETPPRARLKYLLTMVLPSALRIEAVHALFERHVGSPRRWAKEWYLGWAELTSMQRMGHTIGGHGFLHEPYTNMSLMEARADLGRIATVLRAGLGPDRRPFSYPFGRFDRDIGRACKDAGFAEAFTTEEAWVRSRAPAHALPRVDTIRVGSFLPENTL
ncbi:MAG: polysaccharide deacetylase family protein, partial [Planctomycetota bacterium]